MRKGREILGLPVIALAQAAKVGVVRDLVIDPSRRAIVALLLADTTRQKPSRQVSFDAVRRVGPHAVMIEDESAVSELSEYPQQLTLSEGTSRLVGLQVITDTGRTVGTISDVAVDEGSGLIEEYLVSVGPFRDMISGRLSIPASAPTAVGKEYMIVPETAVMDRRALLEEGPTLVVETPPSQMVELSAAEIERISADLVIRQEDLILGMRAGKTIANDDAGGVICFEGEPISEEIIQRAKTAGKLNLLVEAAGEGAIAAMSLGLADQYARVAVGRMAGRTVRTPEGEVIVSQGDAVTPEVVNRAREEGVLDQLMEAVRPSEAGGADRWARRREAARTLWEQIGGGVSRIRRRR